jgi:hypothetical protein
MNVCNAKLGRRLLAVSGLALALAGLGALFLATTGKFLPHDERFLGMAAHDLCAVHGCRIVHFMIHDRGSFGGALVAIGLVYLWLAHDPLRKKESWAWGLFLVTGVAGFASFFAYLGYGYLDTWHGAATLGLLPCFVVGLTQSREARSRALGLRALLQPSVPLDVRSVAGLGRACQLAATAGIAVGGLVIMIVGTTCVFVPQDLEYMNVSVAELTAFNPRLVPLIAHDRAGFGGSTCCAGIALFFSVWCGTPSPGLWRMLCLAGLAGFVPAIGVHPAVGYTDPVHLAPAVLGAVAYAAGLILSYGSMVRGRGQ